MMGMRSSESGVCTQQVDTQPGTSREAHEAHEAPETTPVPATGLAGEKAKNDPIGGQQVGDDDAQHLICCTRPPEEVEEDGKGQGEDDEEGVAPYVDRDAWGREMVDYAVDMFTNCRKLERGSIVSANYMQRQQDVSGSMRAILMRAILIDWLWEVQLKVNFKFESICLGVQLLDRYLARAPCPRRKLMLVGITAMFIACKLEEILYLSVHDWVYLAQRTSASTVQDVYDMEGDFGRTLGFRFALPTACTFIEHYSQNVEPGCKRTCAAAHYACGAASLAIEMVAVLPSKVAFGCMAFSLLNRHRLSSRLVDVYNRKVRCAVEASREPVVELAGALLEQRLRLLESCAQLSRNDPCVGTVFRCIATYASGKLNNVKNATGLFPNAAAVDRQAQSLCTDAVPLGSQSQSLWCQLN